MLRHAKELSEQTKGQESPTAEQVKVSKCNDVVMHGAHSFTTVKLAELREKTRSASVTAALRRAPIPDPRLRPEAPRLEVLDEPLM